MLAATVSAAVIAYFTAECGLTECMPIYAGGLGILSGDHLKAASALGVPLVGVSLLYQEGYVRQVLDASGWQLDRFPSNSFETMPIRPSMRLRPRFAESCAKSGPMTRPRLGAGGGPDARSRAIQAATKKSVLKA